MDLDAGETEPMPDDFWFKKQNLTTFRIIFVDEKQVEPPELRKQLLKSVDFAQPEHKKLNSASMFCWLEIRVVVEVEAKSAPNAKTPVRNKKY